MRLLFGKAEKNAKMKVLTCTVPGHFEYGTLEAPEALPGNSLVRVKRIGVCGTDIHAFEGTQPYFSYPRVLGHELACEFVEGDAEGFEPGEHVTLIPYYYCGTCIACRNGKTNCCQSIKVAGVHIDGGMAEYLSVPSYALVHGKNLSPDALALVEPLSISAHGIRRANVKPGEFVLVNGAGPIGIGVMEFARIAGGKVIVTDVNEKRLRFCREIVKTEYTINALDPDLQRKVADITNGDMPTVIIDATGNQKAINQAFGLMAHGGRYVLIGLQKGEIVVSHPEFHKREGTLMSSRNATRADFEYVIDCLEKKRMDPQTYITHRLDFDEVKDRFAGLFQSGEVIKAVIGFE